ncbi:MAG: hypothetical protein IKY98_05650 [Alphaproteobacteria bacterium]|nr:hypothetical protein [Alphaproteobacteria bacterium]
MKKQIAYSLIFLGIMAFGTAVQAQGFMKNQGRISLAKPTTVLPSVQNLNLESPFRCDVKEVGDIDVMTTLSLSKGDFTLKQKNTGDALPRYEVNGFSFGTMPIDEALQRLVKEADIAVYTQDRVYPELNASDLYGELEPVIAELTKAGDVFYRYDAAGKKLTVSKRGEFELKLPKNRSVMFAVLDALRGADIKMIVPNWNDHSIMLTISRAEEEKVNQLMADIVKEGKLLVADTQVFLLASTAGADWQDVVSRFGTGRIYTANNGMAGKALTMGHHKKSEELLAMLNPTFHPVLISEGVAIVPHGWKMRFDVGRCAVQSNFVSSLSVLLNTKIQKTNEIKTVVSLDTQKGDITTFDIWTGVDEEVALIGIPASAAGFNVDGELFVVLKLRYIRLVGEDKK